MLIPLCPKNVYLYSVLCQDLEGLPLEVVFPLKLVAVSGEKLVCQQDLQQPLVLVNYSGVDVSPLVVMTYSLVGHLNRQVDSTSVPFVPLREEYL